MSTKVSRFVLRMIQFRVRCVLTLVLRTTSFTGDQKRTNTRRVYYKVKYEEMLVMRFCPLIWCLPVNWFFSVKDMISHRVLYCFVFIKTDLYLFDQVSLIQNSLNLILRFLLPYQLYPFILTLIRVSPRFSVLPGTLYYFKYPVLLFVCL